MKHFLITLENGQTCKHKTDLALSTQMVAQSLKRLGYLVRSVLLVSPCAYEGYRCEEVQQ